MPVFLKAEEDQLVVTCGKLRGPEFDDFINKVRSVRGRRWNPTDKQNEFPKDPDTALRLMQMLEPIADTEVQNMVRDHASEIAGNLVTKLPPDATLRVDYADALRPYQRSAVDWLCDHPRSILADEMGLGKTIEAIATMHEFGLRLKYPPEVGTAVLIVCPNAMTGTWHTELETWGGMDSQVIDGKNPAKRQAQLFGDTAVRIVNWEKLRIMPDLTKVPWAAVIADEAHRAKNREAQQTKALWKLKAPVQLALTGTPIMNHPGELWAILRWLRPEQYSERVLGGGYWPFYYSYVDDYLVGKHQRVICGVKNADKLRFELADKLVRRTKIDVLPDLPEKLPTQIIEVDLKPAERKLYEEVEDAVLLDMQAYARKLALEAYIGEEDIDEQALDADTAEKLEELADMPLDRLVGMVENAGARIAKLRQITAGAKVRHAVELITDEPETPVAAFTWHVEAARNLASALRKHKLTVGEIAGNDDPDGPKDAFQLGQLDHIVITIAKGGHGLTLTRSAHPLLVEEDWTPANNDQAIDRTHRFGQKNPVFPRALRVPGTVDTGRVAPKLRIKRMMSEQVLGT